MPVVTFSRDLKGLVPDGNLCSMAGEDILEVSQDCVLYIYYTMFFSKIKNLGFEQPGVKSVPWPRQMH